MFSGGYDVEVTQPQEEADMSDSSPYNSTDSSETIQILKGVQWWGSGLTP